MGKKPIARLEALYKCYLLWSWLSKNPSEGKSSWPGWKDETDCINSLCYACEYHESHKGTYCGKTCIIPVFREKGCICFYGPCSPYRLWERKINRKQNAQKIANSAYKEYKRLGGKL